MMTRKKRNLASSIACGLLCALSAAATASAEVVGDYDGDGKADLAVFDPFTSQFTVRNSSNLSITSGGFDIPLPAGVIPVAGDYDGDGQTDLAVFDRSTAGWYFRPTGGGAQFALQFGSVGGIPVPADYDGDGRVDAATFHKGIWTILHSSTAESETRNFGLGGDIPLAGDVDGDGDDDLIIFRSTGVPTYYALAGGSEQSFPFGLPGDLPVVGDFEGDGRVDFFVFRPDTGMFYRRTGSGVADFEQYQWGLPGDRPMFADVDGDGKIDFVAFRPGQSEFNLTTSTLASFFGLRVASTPLVPATSPGLFTNVPVSVPGDYNRDGRSDVVVAFQGTGVIAWNVSGPGAAFTAALPISANALRSGDMDGDGRADAVGVTDTTAGLLWSVFTGVSGTSAASSFAFGLVGDTPLIGDVDCDGRDDAVVARNLGGLWHWFDRSSTGAATFASGGNPYSVFGLGTDTPYLADMNGDGCDEPVVGRTIPGGGIEWYIANVGSGEINPAAVSFGLDGDAMLPPMDFDGDGDDDLVVVRGSGNTQVAYINTPVVQAVALSAGGSPLAGFFSGLSRAEMASFVGGATPQVVVYGAGGPLSAFAVGAVGSGARTVLTPAGTPLVSNAAARLQEVCPSGIEPFQKGYLWKPESDHSGNPRVGRPAVLFSRNSPDIGCLRVFASDGTPVSQLGVYEFSGRYGARFYTGWGCGDLKYDHEIEQAALNLTGSRETYVERGDGYCIGPFEASDRSGSL